jgi:protoporphyrinogen IX oxidase
MVAWTLVFHIIGLVFWLGSLLVVTHVLAIHVDEPSPEARAALGRLESKLLRGLAHPGAAIMVITGFILIAHAPDLLRQHWLHAKLLLVVILIALDLRVTFRARAFQEGRAAMTRGECMGLHGAIALVFTLILILVFLKPFSAPKAKTQVGSIERTSQRIGMPARANIEVAMGGRENAMPPLV